MYSSNRPPLSPLHLNKGGSLCCLLICLVEFGAQGALLATKMGVLGMN